MSDIREAAERLVAKWGDKAIRDDDALLLAQAWLAEHPSTDDETQIRSMPRLIKLLSRPELRRFKWVEGNLIATLAAEVTIRTAGDARRLLAALGLEAH